jgi:hypothetical protein
MTRNTAGWSRALPVLAGEQEEQAHLRFRGMAESRKVSFCSLALIEWVAQTNVYARLRQPARVQASFR